MIALYPIKPSYTAKILTGEKKYEFRKRLPRPNTEFILIYETYPTCKIVGYAKVGNLIKKDKSKLWGKVSAKAGIDKSFYDSYFQHQDFACAIELLDVYRFNRPFNINEISLDIHVPQSFCYIEKIDFDRIKRRKKELI